MIPGVDARTLPASALPDERDFRSPACDGRCVVVTALRPGQFGRSEILLHHPSPHESYGRALGTAAARAMIDGDMVVTGRLSVNLATYEVLVSGHPVRMTATELRLLLALARRVGMAVEYPDLLRQLWALTEDGESVTSCRHRLRVMATRVREKLGPDAA